MQGENQSEEIDLSTIDNVRVAIFAPMEDELCVFESHRALKTEYINFMPGIMHNHFDKASDSKFVSELIGQLTII